MKNFIIFILFSVNVFSQVGINTNSPQASIDIEGDLRLGTVEETNTAKYVLTVDENQIVKTIPMTSFGSGGTDVIDSRIYAVIPKNADQYFSTKGTTYNVTFDGTIAGINISDISISSDQQSISFPANKAFRVTAMISIKGKKNTGKVSGNPGYITSQFTASTGSSLLLSTQGYVESSTEGYDDGGVTNPIIIFTTGSSGGTIQFSARYSGTDSGTGYYLAGPSSDDSPGSYFLIEELN